MKSRCLIGKIREMSSLLDEHVKNKIKEENLPILKNHIPLFYILSDDGEPMLFNELSRSWKISKSSLSDIISKYEALGFVNKCDCTEDKRNVYISLKKEGIQIRQKLDKIEDEILDDIFLEFSKEEKGLLEIMIDKALKCNTKKL